VSVLARWWQRLTGRDSPANSAPARPTPQPRPAAGSPKTPAAKPEGLELADTPQPKKPGRVGAAGFDPYSSDGGYAKPGTWDRVDHD
jgi:hypothetical protein